MNDGQGSQHRVDVRSLPPAADESVPPGRVVYCVPAAGAGARDFLGAFAQSPLRGCLRVIQLPGREDRLGDPCMDDIMMMAELVSAAIAAEGVADYALFGHSFGALVMLETARRLERMGVPAPAVLAVAACSSPHRSSLHLVEMEPADLAEELRATGRLDADDELGDELAELILPALSADCGAVARYLEGPRREAVATPILAMRGVLDTTLSKEQISSWQESTESDFFELVEYDSGHFFPLESDEPLRAVLDWIPGR